MRAVDRRRQSGQAMVELGLIGMILLTLLLGVAQIGQILYAQVALDTAVREGARVASEQPDASGAYHVGKPTAGVTCSYPGTGSTACQAVFNDAGTLAANQLTVAVAPVAGSTTTQCSGTDADSASDPDLTADLPVSDADDYVNSGYVQVTATYNAPIFVPIFGSILGTGGNNFRTLTASTLERTGPCGLVQFTDTP